MRSFLGGDFFMPTGKNFNRATVSHGMPRYQTGLCSRVCSKLVTANMIANLMAFHLGKGLQFRAVGPRLYSYGGQQCDPSGNWKTPTTSSTACWGSSKVGLMMPIASRRPGRAKIAKPFYSLLYWPSWKRRQTKERAIVEGLKMDLPRSIRTHSCTPSMMEGCGWISSASSSMP